MIIFEKKNYQLFFGVYEYLPLLKFRVPTFFIGQLVSCWTPAGVGVGPGRTPGDWQARLGGSIMTKKSSCDVIAEEDP